MRSDREMLMLAAKAAGIALDYKTMFGGDTRSDPRHTDAPAARRAQSDRIPGGRRPAPGAPRGRTAFVAGATGLIGSARDADWRKWEELATPEEFVRWAKARAMHALRPNAELNGARRASDLSAGLGNKR